MEKTLYPLKFTPIFKDKIWGGNKLNTILHKNTGMTNCGESWELSGVKGNISIVANGFLAGNDLQEILETYMGDLVGEHVYEKYGNEFPLLIKFIDANDILSIQVHPEDDLARERHDSFGKTEMWYIMQADKDADTIVGFNKTINKEIYLEHLKAKKLPEILNFETVFEGDVIFIPSGRVHATGKGILLAEIQQTSDITYRIYDWDRKDDQGNYRELHTDLALDAIDFKAYENYKTVYAKERNKSNNVVKCEYFITNYIEFDLPIKKDYGYLDSFVIYMCLEGSFTLIDNETGHQETLKTGETVLLPALLNDITLMPASKTKILETFIS